MKKLLWLAGMLATSTPMAHAAVTYTFTAYSSMPGDQIPVSISGGFSVTVNNFITGFTDIPSAQLSSCYVNNSGYSCAPTERFLPVAYPGYDAVNFRLTLPNSSVLGPIYFFADGAFNAYGSYQTVEFGDAQFATLTVSRTGAVPEPATWAMAIPGFGLIGGAIRYRRHRRVIAHA